MYAKFVRSEELVAGVSRYSFMPEKSLSYQAGQYLDFRLPDVYGDPRGPGRTFTLTSVPSEAEISFVCRHDEPLSIYKQTLQLLQTGDQIQFGGVMGDLVLPKSVDVPLIFVAGGIGMASFEAMLRELQARGEKREIHLFYSLRSRYDDAFKSLVADFPFASKNIFVKPNFVNAPEIAKSIISTSLVYLSGSERFVIGLRDSLRTLGYGDNQVIFDFYDGYADL